MLYIIIHFSHFHFYSFCGLYVCVCESESVVGLCSTPIKYDVKFLIFRLFPGFCIVAEIIVLWRLGTVHRLDNVLIIREFMIEKFRCRLSICGMFLRTRFIPFLSFSYFLNSGDCGYWKYWSTLLTPSTDFCWCDDFVIWTFL